MAANDRMVFIAVRDEDCPTESVTKRKVSFLCRFVKIIPDKSGKNMSFAEVDRIAGLKGLHHPREMPMGVSNCKGTWLSHKQ